MLGAYAVFANGGYKINPYLIGRITDSNDTEVAHAAPPPGNTESNRVIDVRNAFIMDSMLKGVVRFGTGAKAGAVLKRLDIAGKTGTTNEARDAWFDGYANGGEVAVDLGRLRSAPVRSAATHSQPTWHCRSGFPTCRRL